MKSPAPHPARDDITARKIGTHAKTASPKPARYQIAWQNPVTSETVQIRISHTRDYLARGQDHIEIESLKPKRAALPMTATGYRSHFLPALELINAGGPVSFVTSWLEREAANKSWRQAATAKAQGDLFQWADASRTVSEPKKSRRRHVVSGPNQVVDDEAHKGTTPKRVARHGCGKKPKPPREP